MSKRVNEFGQPIGWDVTGWSPPPPPPREPAVGRFCRVVPLDPDLHATDLYAANARDHEGRNWTYLPYGPFSSLGDYRDWMEGTCLGDDPLFHAIEEIATGKAVGLAALQRIDRKNGAIEVAHVNFSPLLQRTPAATEAMYLLMERVFQLGYRRYEWKCDALNGSSRAAAQRLGFSYEGIFRQAIVYKGRNRDTAWYAAIDREWPALGQAFRRWLSPENFGPDGSQKVRLSELTTPILTARDRVDQLP